MKGFLKTKRGCSGVGESQIKHKCLPKVYAKQQLKTWRPPLAGFVVAFKGHGDRNADRCLFYCVQLPRTSPRETMRGSFGNFSIRTKPGKADGNATAYRAAFFEA